MYPMEQAARFAKRTALGIACSLPLVTISSGASAATVSNAVFDKVEAGTNVFDQPACVVTISFSATGVTADTSNSGDILHLALGSGPSPQIHGIAQTGIPVGTTVNANGVSVLAIDRFGAYTPEPYAVRFFDTTTLGAQSPLPQPIAEIPIRQSNLRAAGGVCLDAVVDRRSPRNGTVGN